MTWCDYNGNYTQKSQRNNRLFWGSYKGSYILTATEAHCHAKQWLVGIWPCERQQPIKIENKQKTKHHQSMSRVDMWNSSYIQTEITYTILSLAVETHIPWPLNSVLINFMEQFRSMPLLNLNEHHCQSAYQVLPKFYWTIDCVY